MKIIVNIRKSLQEGKSVIESTRSAWALNLSVNFVYLATNPSLL